jgi:hypothetical protein
MALSSRIKLGRKPFKPDPVESSYWRVKEHELKQELKVERRRKQ